jgi:broad specificity phosphatase PhoE
MGVVLLVRHGQASFGADDYDVLSETGVEQSRRLGRVLAEQGLAPVAVVHGAMRRQRDTAAEMI